MFVAVSALTSSVTAVAVLHPRENFFLILVRSTVSDDEMSSIFLVAKGTLIRRYQMINDFIHSIVVQSNFKNDGTYIISTDWTIKKLWHHLIIKLNTNFNKTENRTRIKQITPAVMAILYERAVNGEQLMEIN